MSERIIERVVVTGFSRTPLGFAVEGFVPPGAVRVVQRPRTKARRRGLSFLEYKRRYPLHGVENRELGVVARWGIATLAKELDGERLVIPSGFRVTPLDDFDVAQQDGIDWRPLLGPKRGPVRPCCNEHPEHCPMCKQPWSDVGAVDGEECWNCGRLVTP